MPEERFEDWLTTGEAFTLTGLSPSQLTKLCRAGKITARQRGREWYLLRASLAAWMQEWHPEIKLEGKED
jgi:hypothetical protein